MKKKELIIHLLIQEYKFSQLIGGLDRCELAFERWLDISEAIASLMKINEGQIPDQWLDKYLKYSRETQELDFWSLSELSNLARKAYEDLCQYSY